MNYRPQLNSALGIKTDVAELDENVKYFTSEFSSVEKQVEEEGKLCTELEAEGAVLLKNENGLLPFSSDAKFSLFSTSSVDPIYGGTGSGQVSTNDAINFRKAMNTEFGGTSTNVDLYKRYLQDLSSYRRVNAGTTGGTIDQYKINEAPWAEVMTSDIEASMSNYPNAIVVLSRSGGEGNDLPMTECSDGTNGNYLVLNQNEKDMLAGLKALKDAGKVSSITVLLNGSNALQLDFLDSDLYDIDACAWIGGVGTTGMTAVAELLSGKRNFSGRLSDTFLKDNLSAPSIANFGLRAFTNSSAKGATGEYDTSWVQYNKAGDSDKCNENYIVYQEGIYIGYRYYETRYADYVMGQGNTSGYSYGDDVAFPFGYGDSYTSWTYSDFTIEEKDDIIEASVKVTNSGSVSGKNAVEIYVAPTYTDYDKENSVEKSAIVLGGFNKTAELDAGESERVTVTVKKRDLASYDTNGKKTFILDGDYHFTVGKNAHDANNNVLTFLGYGDKVDAAGNSNLVKTWSVSGVDDITASTSEETGYKITNAFDHVDLNRYEGTSDQKITYLTRSNWNATFPTAAVSLKINEKMWKDGLDYSPEARTARVKKMMEEHYSEYIGKALPDMGVDSGLTTVMLRTVEDLTDERYQKLVSQATYSELTNLIYNGFHVTLPVSSMALPSTKDENGPQGFTASLVGGAEGAHGMAYTSEDVMASTRNISLLKRMGECIGEDMLNAKYAGLYGPGSNIHRNPYCGRNFEYYSEDPVLSSHMQEHEVAGIQSKGVYVFTKHFALNDQESGRYGLSTWANEQSIRELYLRAFEGTALGGGSGVMTSFNRMGVVWAGSDYSLMTTVLRNEWGMKGAAITDCSVFASYMDPAAGVLAGQDLWDGSYGENMATLDGYRSDPVMTRAVQKAAKHIVYSISHSLAMNGYVDTTTIKVSEEWYLTLTKWLGIGSAIIAGASAAMLVVTIVLNKKKAKAA